VRDVAEEAAVVAADVPLHLEDHVDAARVEGSDLPTTIPAPVEWRFSEPAGVEGRATPPLQLSLSTSSVRIS
jgi:hypothetical protein